MNGLKSALTYIWRMLLLLFWVDVILSTDVTPMTKLGLKIPLFFFLQGGGVFSEYGGSVAQLSGSIV